MTKMRRKQFFNEPTRKEIIPYDSLIGKTKSIISNRVFSLTALIRCKSIYYSVLSDGEFQQLLKKYQIESSTSPVVLFFNDPIIMDELKYWQREGRRKYIESLYVLPVYRHEGMTWIPVDSRM